MGLTVDHQRVKNVTVNRQKWKILTIKRLRYLLSRSIIASNNDIKSTISLDTVFPNELF